MKISMKRRIFTAFGITIFCMLIALILIRGTSVQKCKYGLEGYDYNNCYTYDCVPDENGFRVTGWDPQIVYTFPQEVYGVRFQFTDRVNPLPKEALVYYSGSYEGISESRTIKFDEIEGDTLDIMLWEPSKIIRLDIEEDFTIVSLEIYSLRAPVSQSRTIWVILSALVSLALGVGLSFCNAVHRFLAFLGSIIAGFFHSLVENAKRIVKYVLITEGCVLLTNLIYRLIVGKKAFNKYQVITYCAMEIVVALVLFFRKTVMTKPQLLFFILVMYIGTFNIVMEPTNVGISWDDEIHYGRSVFLSYGGKTNFTNADKTFINEYTNVIYHKSEYLSKNGREFFERRIENIYKDNAYYPGYNYNINYTYISYVPSALGLIVARGLGMSFVSVFRFGKLFNLLFYAILMTSAIAILKNRGRYIICGIGLIPTSIFIASTYSYDCWVIGFITLGYALAIQGVRDTEDEKKKQRSWFISMLLFVVGILPKAIYFPLILPLFFICLKNVERKDIKKYVLLSLVAMSILAMTFILPRIFHGMGSGDSRGGEGVNSAKQLQYILSNPGEYAGTLTNFLKDYLSPNAILPYLACFAYLGQKGFGVLCGMMIVIMALFDNSASFKRVNVLAKTSVYVLSFVTACLAATAMYISFTPVASETINGCQIRYMFPVFFPLLLCLTEARMEPSEETKQKVMCAGMAILSIAFLAALNDLCMCLY